MGYVVYIKKSTMLVSRKVFKTEAAAKASITRGKRMQLIDPRLVAIAEVNHFYANIDRKVERVNLLSGKTYMESVNTPSYCSASSESYWSM